MKFSSFEQPTIVEEMIITELEKHGKHVKKIHRTLIFHFFVWLLTITLVAYLISRW